MRKVLNGSCSHPHFYKSFHQPVFIAEFAQFVFFVSAARASSAPPTQPATPVQSRKGLDGRPLSKAREFVRDVTAPLKKFRCTLMTAWFSVWKIILVMSSEVLNQERTGQATGEVI